MKNTNSNTSNPRRDFIGKLAAGAAAMGMASIVAPVNAVAGTEMPVYTAGDPEAWLARIKGKHRIAFDVTHPNETMPFAWPKVFLMTNGAAAKDCSVVVILRHDAIPFTMNSDLWAKYKFGELFKINDPLTKAPAVRNPFWEPKTGDYTVPGIGNVDIGINQLMQEGVLFCACDVAITVFSAVTAAGMNGNAAEIKKEWEAGLLPGVQLVPSGVWAVGRVQEHGCSYCFAG
ncbi:MAG TPA: twin-arginine translocation signal domain-containing protein [Puia sp.]|nr:twin-arginine translocation signal domain-containing protein [Puia sp.]